MITFANSLEPDQDQQNVGPGLDQICLILIMFLKEFFEKDNFEENQHTTAKAFKITQHADELHFQSK